MRSGVGPSIDEIRSLGERPAPSALGLSFLLHCAGVLLFVVLLSSTGPKLVRPHLEVAEVIPLKPHVAFAPMRAGPRGNGGSRAGLLRAPTSVRHASTPQLSAGEALQREAKRESAAIINSLKFEEIYGFYPGHKFKLPVRQSGDLPHISRDQVPPHYEQMVLIDITIDTEGKVADARIVAGLVGPEIQQILLSAVREFRYAPATRDDVPIPSQVEIVIPVPS